MTDGEGFQRYKKKKKINQLTLDAFKGRNLRNTKILCSGADIWTLRIKQREKCQGGHLFSVRILGQFRLIPARESPEHQDSVRTDLSELPSLQWSHGRQEVKKSEK